MRIITPTSARRRAGYFPRIKAACSRFVLEPFLNTLSLPSVNRSTCRGRTVWSRNCIILHNIAIPERRPLCGKAFELAERHLDRINLIKVRRSDARIGAGWQLNAIANLSTERRHQCQHDAVRIERFDAVGKDATVALIIDVMLSASDEVDARFPRRLKVAQTSRIGRDQRGGAVPVFRGVVHVEQFGDCPEHEPDPRWILPQQPPRATVAENGIRPHRNACLRAISMCIPKTVQTGRWQSA